MSEVEVDEDLFILNDLCLRRHVDLSPSAEVHFVRSVRLFE